MNVNKQMSVALAAFPSLDRQNLSDNSRCWRAQTTANCCKDSMLSRNLLDPINEDQTSWIGDCVLYVLSKLGFK